MHVFYKSSISRLVLLQWRHSDGFRVMELRLTGPPSALLQQRREEAGHVISLELRNSRTRQEKREGRRRRRKDKKVRLKLPSAVSAIDCHQFRHQFKHQHSFVTFKSDKCLIFPLPLVLFWSSPTSSHWFNLSFQLEKKKLQNQNNEPKQAKKVGSS